MGIVNNRAIYALPGDGFFLYHPADGCLNYQPAIAAERANRQPRDR
jgi:hypothetical protein